MNVEQRLLVVWEEGCMGGEVALDQCTEVAECL